MFSILKPASASAIILTTTVYREHRHVGGFYVGGGTYMAIVVF